MTGLPDEYQDGASAGSLVKARRCWRDLVRDEALHVPQQFIFGFHCPTEQTALRLIEFLQNPHDAGYESTTARVVMSNRDPSNGDPWKVEGTTHVAVWSLASLEHLFMRMRGAGRRHESDLLHLDLLPLAGGLP